VTSHHVTSAHDNTARCLMDKLLVACHSQSLNLFVESFLKMVQKLLECSDPEMQCLATVSVSSS